MLEIAMIVASGILMYRVAEIDNESGPMWAGIAVATCVLSLFVIPWMLLRIGIATVAVFVGMIVYRMVKDR